MLDAFGTMPLIGKTIDSQVAQLVFHGAAGTVTGSCYELRLGRSRLLVDCGLFQGTRTLEQRNFAELGFDPARIDTLLLTHAHLDHSGLLPRLTAEGFEGNVWCTPATADLLPHLLRDSARLSEQDAERRNRRRDRAGEQPIEPLYTLEDVERLLRRLRVAEIGEDFAPCPDITVRFWNAGHVLGSASVDLRATAGRILFSGDIGSTSATMLDPPEGPSGVDHLVVEATYGDRERMHISREQRRSALEREIRTGLARGGNVLIPAFALERTQELLLDLAVLINDGRLQPLGVFIDSPLATRITSVFAHHASEIAGADAAEALHHAAFRYVEDVPQSRALASVSGAIILAGSGMCEGGRIRHHLLNNLARTDSTLLFVGYQASGTLGRTILDGARRVRISGQDVAVRLHVREIGSYSAHADRHELIDWVKARQPVTGSIFVTHGEAPALESLAEALRTPANSVIVPGMEDSYALSPNRDARRIRAGRAEQRAGLNRDWQNDYADFAVNLKQDLARIGDERRRREAIARMRSVLQSYRTARAERRSSRAEPPAD